MNENNKYHLCGTEKIESWDEGIPLGNGRCGCLIWGDSQCLRFSLDRGDLWDETPAKETLLEEFSFQTMINYVKMGKQNEIRALFDRPYYHPTPTKIPAGKICLTFLKQVSLNFQLDLQMGEAYIYDEQKEVEIRCALHAVENFGVIEISGDNHPQCMLFNPEFGKTGEKEPESGTERHISQGSLKKLKYPEVQRGRDEDIEWFFQETKDFVYGIILGCKKKEDKTLFVYQIVSSKDSADWKEKAEKKIKKLLEKSYIELVAGHRKWWENYWERSAVSVPESTFENNWYLTNYLLASCSRKGELPMPLQGVWSADNGELPPWKGDYHNDLNTQLSYSHYLKANHLEEGECFLDYLWDMRFKAKEFAEKFYGTEGICLPAVMSAGGQALGGWPMYALMPSNQLWLAQLFARYYECTGNQAFLKERAYPYLKESYLCIRGLLKEDENGYFRLPVSSSPEIHDDELDSWVMPNSNYDLALMRYAVEKLKEFSEVLGNKEREKWEADIKKFPCLAVSREGVLMLSPNEQLKESHRHHSHAMGIYPLDQLDVEKETDKRIIDATILDLETLGTGRWVGFSFTWMALLYTRQRNGNGAAHCLETFWRYFCGANGFHLNGDFKGAGVTSFHYRPFTLEANMSAADALQEMLLQTQKGRIHLFPAIPDEWKKKKLSFQNFRGEKGLLISAAYDSQNITKLVLKAEYDGVFELYWDKRIPFYLKGIQMEETHRGYKIYLQANRTYSWNSEKNEGDRL